MYGFPLNPKVMHGTKYHKGVIWEANELKKQLTIKENELTLK